MTSLLPQYITTLGKKIDLAEQQKDPSWIDQYIA